jgi:hypothetical protein
VSAPINYPPDLDFHERLRMAEAEIVRLRAALAARAEADKLAGLLAIPTRPVKIDRLSIAQV